jgi:hypothetical protein
MSLRIHSDHLSLEFEVLFDLGDIEFFFSILANIFLSRLAAIKVADTTSS